MAKRRLVLTASLAVLAATGCACSSASSPPNAGKASTSVNESPSSWPATTTTSSSTTTTTVPSGLPTTVPIPSDPPAGWAQALTTLPPGGGFSSVSCISDVFCIASGGGTGGQASDLTAGSGVTMSWDGATWSNPSVYFPAPTAGAITAPVLPTVSCTSGPTCVIVDGAGHVSTGDGTNWSSVAPLIAGPTLAANPADPGAGHSDTREMSVSCPTPKFCAAVDNTGHAYTMRGSSWLPTQSLGRSLVAGSPASALYQTGKVGVSCPTVSACVAVVGTSVLDWNGSSWSLEPAQWTAALTDGSTATAISCPTTTLCAIVNGTGLSYRNGGSTWSTEQTIDPHGGLDAISCPTTSFCMAADADGYVLSWNGQSWSDPQQVLPAATQYPGVATSLSCPNVHSCMLINADGDYSTYSSN